MMPPCLRLLFCPRWLLIALLLTIGHGGAYNGAQSGSFFNGFFDCSGGEAVTKHAVRRAYRQLSLENHPDKGGSDETAADFTELRDSWLREPLRFHIFRAMFDGAAVLRGSPPSNMSSGTQATSGNSTVKEANVEIVWIEHWPYVKVKALLQHGSRLRDGGSWTFALGLKGVSTVHYHGDKVIGGYDVCCEFLEVSKCRRRPQNDHGDDRDTCGSGTDGVTGSDCKNAPTPHEYLESDCPLPAVITATVRRPLHLNSTGQWGAALQVRDMDGEEVACIAFAFGNNGHPNQLSNAESVSSQSKGYKTDKSAENMEFGQHQEFTDGQESFRSAEGSAESSGSIGETNTFRPLRVGGYCEDGADMLEGFVDDYGGLPPLGGSRRADAESSMFYGSKCRDKCRKRKKCQFYTVYSSGWCQLSTRCANLAGAGDPLTVTFEKVV